MRNVRRVARSTVRLELVDYSDDDIFAEDWADPYTRRARLERALDLVDLLKTLLQAVATRMDKPSAADKRSYHDDQRSLALRHGRLAVRAAIAWAAFMLDTLHDLHPES